MSIDKDGAEMIARWNKLKRYFIDYRVKKMRESGIYFGLHADKNSVRTTLYCSFN